MSIHPTQLTELARRAAEAGVGKDFAVEYRLVQGGDILAALRAMAATAPPVPSVNGADHDPRMPICNMTAFRAAGLGAVSCTWASAEHAVNINTHAGREQVHSGRAVLNPSFLHDSTEHVELMLSLGVPPWNPTMADCQILTQITHDLLELAAAAGSVLFLHSPVAPAPRDRRGDGSEEVPRDDQGPCLRMLVGMERRGSDPRLAFELDVTRLAQQYGLGLWLADRRFDRARGEWFKIRSFVRETYQEKMDELPASTTRPPERGLVLSNVGPAKQGIALKIVKRLAAQSVGLLGISVSALQGVGFVNYLLAIDESQLDSSSKPHATWTDRWAVTLSEVEALWEPVSGAPNAGNLPQGYEVTLGPQRRCYFPSSSRRTGAGKDARAPYPLWVAWEAPSNALSALDVLDTTSARIGVNAESHRLVYAQSRLVSPELMRGRAKFSVVLPDNRGPDLLPAQDALENLAAAVEDSTVDWLTKDRRLPQARCRVSATERWLRYARTMR